MFTKCLNLDSLILKNMEYVPIAEVQTFFFLQKIGQVQSSSFSRVCNRFKDCEERLNFRLLFFLVNEKSDDCDIKRGGLSSE